MWGRACVPSHLHSPLLPLLCACPALAASGDRLLMRWFDEDRRGFAFGCVFATGEVRPDRPGPVLSFTWSCASC